MIGSAAGSALFEVSDIPPAPPREPNIEVTFHVNGGGILTVTAKDGRTGRDLPVLQR